MVGREVTITVNLEERENEDLEIAALITEQTPDDILKAMQHSISKYVKGVISDFQHVNGRLSSLQRRMLLEVCEIKFGENKKTG